VRSRSDRIAHNRRKDRPFPPPDYLLWEITLRCNLKCLHCAARAGRPRAGELSTEEALDLCDQIADLGIPSVALMGGEPLLRKDWKILARRLISRGVRVGLVTNGFLFDEKTAAECEAMGICQVCVSLDAADPAIHDRIRGARGSHERAVRAIKIVGSMDIPYRNVITSINRHNIGELDALLGFMLEHTRDFIWIINHSSERWGERQGDALGIGKEGYVRIARFIDKHRKALAGRINISGTHGLGYFSRRYRNLHDFRWEGCLAGIKALGVRSNGDVTGCLILPDPFIEGNIRRRSLADLWRDPEAFAATRRFDGRKLRGKCRGCEFAGVCKAGCTNMAYCSLGTIYEYPYCLHHEERSREEISLSHRGRRCAPTARREEGAYSTEYVTDEQRSCRGCSGGRM
jgi:radical SAM protein with 4Fe4S-binding SPASM domain